MVREYAETVYQALGPGYSERVYHKALEVLLRKEKIPYESERIVPIDFMGHVVGNLRADLILNCETVLELKSVQKITDSMITQARNYLHLTGLRHSYLVNFPPTTCTDLEVRYVGLD
jgi:GxxExxY protein|tara:strand:+ start:5393 stop:5743 length:351 start_codon:yes stop_codon:yes gene_type:complete